MSKDASEWVRRFLPGVRPGGRVLDVACGSGRHLSLALGAGYVVTGIDRDTSRARDTLTGEAGRWPANVDLVELDLEDGSPFPVPAGTCDGVIVTNYLWRPLLPGIVAAVSHTGLLIYETFATGNGRFGKPSNPAFLLQPGELIDVVAGRLTPIAYEHVHLRDPDRYVQRIAAVGLKHDWLRDPPAF
ncbi:conserved protein of unknown function [Candidatus Filomicrobium marinum]|uniref:Methyltransferase domain-containing protein n=1 Tax=Candidatus Filomicrobium marinum TaxID=1608628 RepID=A0A0D6JCM7_9HYPH|nr:conserved protein of unknown function [Candidatus Filomicrobium marinum]CPR16596.1 conserved protein of unknown function [Candidatus Filomicrobium marinum]